MAHSRLTLCDPGDCSFRVHGISQARTLERLAPQDLPHARIEPGSPALAGGSVTAKPPGKALWTVLKRVEFTLRTGIG